MSAPIMLEAGNDHGRWIEIDLNVRIHAGRTWTIVGPGLAATLEVGCAYVIGESESGLTFPATLVDRRGDGYVEFDVAWDKGKVAQ